MPNPDREHAILDEDVSLEAMNDPSRIKSPRELAMERLEADHLRRSQLEAGLPVNDPAPTPAPTPVPEPAPAPADDQLAAQLAGDDVIADPAGKKVRVKVDGVEQDVSLDEVLRNYQKGSAADRRLEEATRLLKEAQKTAATTQQPAPATPEPAATPPAAGPDALVDPVKTALGHLYSGDEDAAAKALAEVIARNAAPAATPQAVPLDPVQLVAQVQEQMAFQGALDKVKTDYPDLLGSGDLEQLTFIKAKAYVGEGRQRADALLAAANDVYSLIGKKAGRQEEPPPRTLRQEKQDRKAALDPVPAASMAAGSGPTEEEEQSPSAVIAAMAKQRLGQSMPPGR